MEIKKGQITRIFNGEIITPEKNLGIGTVLISEGKIIGVEPGNYKVADSVDYDAQGGLSLPVLLICIRMGQAIPISWIARKKIVLPLHMNILSTEQPCFILLLWLRIIRNYFVFLIYMTA